mgnify:CR=1 FL=1
MSDDSLRRGNALFVRVDGLCLAKRAGEALEEPFANVVRLVAVYLAEVDVRAAFDGDGAEELLDELNLEVLDEHVLHLDAFALSKYISRRKADFTSNIITDCYVVFCGKAVRVNARYQTRKEIESKLETLRP